MRCQGGRSRTNPMMNNFISFENHFEKRKKSVGVPVHKRKMFQKNSDMIFEQDFASPHSTNIVHEFMENNFPAYTPTLWRMQDHEHFFGAKWDDFWSIEEWWAVMSHKVYRNPRPKSIDAVMRRVAEAVRTADPNVLTKMVHQLPAKMNEIFRQKDNEPHQTLKLQRVLLHANVPSAPPKLSPSKYLQPPTHTPPHRSCSLRRVSSKYEGSSPSRSIPYMRIHV